MKRTFRLTLIALTVLVSLTLLVPAPLALAQGPVDEPDNAANPGPEPVLVPDIESDDDPNANRLEFVLPDQDVPQGDIEVSIAPPPVDTAPGDNDLSAEKHSPDALPALLDALLADLNPQVKAALAGMAEDVMEQLRGWAHKEADEISNSFGRWLHSEVDRLLASFESWLTAQLDGADGDKTIELEPVEG
jgi:hypothetical protein